jgi:hypothetical protein
MAKFFFLFFFSMTMDNIFQGTTRVGSKPTWAVLPPEEHSPKQNKKQWKTKTTNKEKII